MAENYARGCGIRDETLNLLYSHYVTCCKRYTGGDNVNSKNYKCTADHLVHYFSLQRTPFNNFLMTHYNPEQNAYAENDWVEFEHFLIAMWAFSTMMDNIYDMARFLWDAFDVYGDGYLMGDELLFMFGNFMYGDVVPGYVKKKLSSVLPVSSADRYDFNTLVKILEVDEAIIIPVMDAHKKVRNTLSKDVYFWAKEVSQRRSHHGVDSGFEILNMSSLKNDMAFLRDMKKTCQCYGIRFPSNGDKKLDMMQKNLGIETGPRLKKTVDAKQRERERANKEKGRQKAMVLAQRAQLEASKAMRRFSQRMLNANGDPEVERILARKKAEDKYMKRRDSNIGALGWNIGGKSEKGGKKEKPEFYHRVRNLSQIAIENLGAIGKNMGKKGKKKKQRLQEGDLYAAPEDAGDGDKLMSGTVHGGIRLKDDGKSKRKKK